MSGALAHPPQPVTREDLKVIGVTDEQIARFEELRAQYPYIEFLSSTKELDRLKFVKWLIARQEPDRS